MKVPSRRKVTNEAKLLLIGIPVFLWTMLPIYHLFLFAISPKESAFGGKLWPDEPTLNNFVRVFGEKHYFLENFWIQLWNSLLIAVTVGALPPGTGGRGSYGHRHPGQEELYFVISGTVTVKVGDETVTYDDVVSLLAVFGTDEVDRAALESAAEQAISRMTGARGQGGRSCPSVVAWDRFQGQESATSIPRSSTRVSSVLGSVLKRASRSVSSCSARCVQFQPCEGSSQSSVIPAILTTAPAAVSIAR